MDFRFKAPKPGGLNIGFLPGSYQGAESHSRAMRISEDAFWFLEPSIRERCSSYSSLSHYGITQISREDWRPILSDWTKLVAELQSARLTTDLKILRAIPRHVRASFIRDMRRNCLSLSRLIETLVPWIHAAIAEYGAISVLGI